MSYRTGGEPRSSPQTFIRMTCLTVFISTRHLRAIRRIVANRDNPADCASGGAGRDRTDDILLAKQALSQLSYTPAR